MAWIYYVRHGGLSDPSEIYNNTDIMYNVFINQYGGTLEAFCALLGNVYAESGYNPGNMETVEPEPNYNDGLGLIQWTKSPIQSQNPLLDWTEDMGYRWYDGDRQMWLIMEEHNVGAWLPSIVHPEYNYTWEQFMQMTDIELAVKTYLWERERPNEQYAQSTLPDRIQQARDMYQHYAGHPPTPPTPTTPKKKLDFFPLLYRKIMNGKYF